MNEAIAFFVGVSLGFVLFGVLSKFKCQHKYQIPIQYNWCPDCDRKVEIKVEQA